MRRWGICLLITVLNVLVLHQGRADVYNLLETKTYRLVNRFTITNTSPYPITEIKARVLVGEKDATLYQKLLSYKIDPTPTKMRTDDTMGNLYAVVEIGRINAGEQRTITVEKIVQNSGINFSQEIGTLDPDYTAFHADPANAQYYSNDEFVQTEADKQTLATVVQDVSSIPTTKTVVQRAWDTYSGVNQYLTYDMAYSHIGPLQAYLTKRGVCTEFAGLFVLLCRASTKPIPARVVSGYWLPSDHYPLALNTPVSIKDSRHAWAEFYLPGVGWIPVEPTMISTVNGQRVSSRNFALIQPTDRHLVWALGMESQHKSNIDVVYQAPPNTSPNIDLADETITWIPNPPTPAPQP